MHKVEEGYVVDSLLIVALIVCGDLVCSHSFVMQYLVSFLCLQSSRRGREIWLLYFSCMFAVMRLLMFCDSSLWVSAVCECGISWSYSLTFREKKWAKLKFELYIYI